MQLRVYMLAVWPPVLTSSLRPPPHTHTLHSGRPPATSYTRLILTEGSILIATEVSDCNRESDWSQQHPFPRPQTHDADWETDRNIIRPSTRLANARQDGVDAEEAT